MLSPKTQGRLPNSLLLYKASIIALSLGIILIGYQYWQLKRNLISNASTTTGNAPQPSSHDLPFYKEIMDIIRPLDYSGLESLARENVSLSIDFARGAWTLHNLHQYTPDGKIILDNGRSGLCGELASYTFEKLMTLLTDNFEVKFAKVAESGFFLSPTSSHIVLLIYDKSKKEFLLLDPTFHKYGRMDDFDEYSFFGASDKLGDVQNMNKDVEFQIEHGTPVLIRNDLISLLSVTGVDGKFDRDNFMLVLKANRRYNFSGRFLFAIRKKDGEISAFDNPWLENQALTSGEIDRLKKKMAVWIKNI